MSPHQRAPVEPSESTPTLGAAAVRQHTEQLYLRNYDRKRHYQLKLSISRPDHPAGYSAVYELSPEEVVSERELLPPGKYDIAITASFQATGDDAVRAAGDVEASAVCNVGDRPPQTVVIECGNGIVSIAEGLLR